MFGLRRISQELSRIASALEAIAVIHQPHGQVLEKEQQPQERGTEQIPTSDLSDIPAQASDSVTEEIKSLVKDINHKENQKEPNLTSTMVDWLRDYRLGVDHINNSISDSNATENLSVFIVSQYELVAPLMNQLSKAANGRTQINLNLSNQRPEVISACCHVANQLNNIGFLQYYNYKKSPQCTLILRANGLPVSTVYLGGRWLEQAVANLIRSHAESNLLRFQRNLVLRNEKGTQREVDLLLDIVQHIYVFEVCTGSWRSKIAQVISLATQLKIPTQDCVLIVLAEPSQELEDLAQLHQCHIVAFSQLSAWLDEQIEQLSFNGISESEEDLPEAISIC